MNISIIGAGSFGSALAQELSRNPDNQLQLLFQNEEDASSFNKTMSNEKYFPGYRFYNDIKGICSWEKVKGSQVIFLAIPSNAIDIVAKKLQQALTGDELIINLVKGIHESGKTIVEYLQDFLNHHNIVSLKGPSFGEELILGQATLLTLGFTKRHQLKTVQRITSGTNIYLDYTQDIKGVELLSTLKNIYAIVIGAVDARHNGANTRFLILTKAISEIRLILRHLGGDENTIFLGCGLGDISLTSLNDMSRNRTLGLLIGKGFYNPSYETDSVVLEGLKTLQLIEKVIPDTIMEQLPILLQIKSFFLKKQTSALNFDFNQLFNKNYKTVLTYGTYDLLHYGHLEILRRAKELGDRLIVGLSTDEFNEIKGKKCVFPYEKRRGFLESLSYVDLVIPESSWEQKVHDVQTYEVDVFVMGHDWSGKFDFLQVYCEVQYFPRTAGISTTKLKKIISE